MMTDAFTAYPMAMLLLFLLAGCGLTAVMGDRSQALQSVKSITAYQFIEALYNQDVSIIWIHNDLTMFETDWSRYSTPLVLRRDVNISGVGTDILSWPVVDLGFSTAKVIVAKNVTLSFSHLVLQKWRRGPAFQAPGIDLIASNPDTADHSWEASMPNVRFTDMAWIQRGCLAPEFGRQVTAQMQRPSFLPGIQRLSTRLPQPGCVNSSDAPLMQQCWPMALQYDDVVTYGYNLDGFDPVQAGYMLWLQNTPVRCETTLDADCIAKFDGSVYACFLILYPNVSPPPPHNAGAGVSGRGTQRRAAVLGGIMGGLAFLTAVTAAMVVLLQRRRRGDGCHTKSSSGGAMCPADASTAGRGKAKSSSKGIISQDGSFWNQSSYRRTANVSDGVPENGSCQNEGRGVPVAGEGRESGAGASDSCEAGSQQRLSFTYISVLKDTSVAAPITQLTPLKPDVNLHLDLGGGGALELLPGTIGKGTFGRVVPGRYGGQPVAVKLLDHGLLMYVHSGGGSGAEEVPESMMQMLPLGQATANGTGGGGLCAVEAALPPPSPPVRPRPAVGAAVAVSVAAFQQGQGISCVSCGGFEGSGAGGSKGAPSMVTLAEDCRQEAESGFPAAGPEARVAGTFSKSDEDGCEDSESAATCNDQCGTAGGGGGACAVEVQAAPPPRPADPAQRSLVQEVEVLARCRHPNVVRLLAACLTPPRMCLVMELMETSLDRLLYGNGSTGNCPMPLTKVLHIALQMAAGLEYLHPTIMHRDLKPGNVLLRNADGPTPLVKLADFGLSRVQTSVLVTEHAGVGTIAYMAPETLHTSNIAITHQVDIYALGIILWELLAGVRPWAGLGLVQIAVAVELRKQRPPLESLPPERCPPKLRSLIGRCWDPVPERRPAAAEVVKELLQLQLMRTNDGKGRSNSVSALPTRNPSTSNSPKVPVVASAKAGGGTDGIAAVRVGGGDGDGPAISGTVYHPVADQVAALACYGLPLPDPLPDEMGYVYG